jgi:hypothetical protein
MSADLVEHRAEIGQRRIGAWAQPALADIDAAAIGRQRIDATPSKSNPLRRRLAVLISISNEAPGECRCQPVRGKAARQRLTSRR